MPLKITKKMPSLLVHLPLIECAKKKFALSMKKFVKVWGEVDNCVSIKSLS